MSSIFDEIYDEDNSILDETIQFFAEATQSKHIIGTKEMKKRLLTQCELQCAKDINDPLYKKYKKATQIRRKCRKLIHEKYQGKAKARLKVYLKERQAKGKKKL